MRYHRGMPRRRTKPTERRIIRLHSTASFALVGVYIALPLLLSAIPSMTFTASNLVLVVLGTLAVLTSLGSLVAFWLARHRVAPGRRVDLGIAVLFTVGALCLIVSWGTTVEGWIEEIREGMSLPIINLFLLLLPVGLIFSLITAGAARAPAAGEEGDAGEAEESGDAGEEGTAGR